MSSNLSSKRAAQKCCISCDNFPQQCGPYSRIFSFGALCDRAHNPRSGAGSSRDHRTRGEVRLRVLHIGMKPIPKNESVDVTETQSKMQQHRDKRIPACSNRIHTCSLVVLVTPPRLAEECSGLHSELGVLQKQPSPAVLERTIDLLQGHGLFAATSRPARKTTFDIANEDDAGRTQPKHVVEQVAK
eukprot:2182578-Amphidinium_carterae.1